MPGEWCGQIQISKWFVLATTFLEKFGKPGNKVLVGVPQSYSRWEILRGAFRSIVEKFRRMCCFVTCWSWRVYNNWVVPLTKIQTILSGAGLIWELNKFGLSTICCWVWEYSGNSFCQQINFHSAVLCSLNAKRVQLDFRSYPGMMKNK